MWRVAATEVPRLLAGEGFDLCGGVGAESAVRRERRLHLYEHGRLCKREGENRVFGFAGGGA